MIKFTTTGGDGIVRIGLGLVEGNVTRMRAGQPVVVKLKDLGFHGPIGTVQIMIILGPDEVTLAETLRPFFGPETVIIHK